MKQLTKLEQEILINRIKLLNDEYTYKEISVMTGISEVYFYKIVSGEKIPSKKVYRNIKELCEEKNIINY